MLETFETVAKAIADSTRIRILKLLESGELCVCQITAVLNLAPATVSKHLSALKMAGLLEHRRNGKWIYYRRAGRAFNPYAQDFLVLVEKSLQDDSTLSEDRRRLAIVNTVPVQALCGHAASGLENQASVLCCEENLPAPAAVTDHPLSGKKS